MGVITSIEKQKNNKHRYSIYMDDHYFAALDEEMIVKAHIKTGMDMDEATLSQWILEDELKKAFEKSLSFLGYRPRSGKETMQYLERKGFDPSVIQKTIEKLEYYRYINDEDFAKAWVQDRKVGKNVGKMVIRQELTRKGIHRDIAQEALEDITEEDELERATQWVQKLVNKKTGAGVDQRMLLQKISQTLFRKGFGWEVIHKALHKASIDLDEDHYE